MFKNLKAAKEMMANMDPDDLKDLMEQAKNQQAQMEETIRRIVREEIAKSCTGWCGAKSCGDCCGASQNLVRKEDLEK
jgi:hypothetical protein